MADGTALYDDFGNYIGPELSGDSDEVRERTWGWPQCSKQCPASTLLSNSCFVGCHEALEDPCTRSSSNLARHGSHGQ